MNAPYMMTDKETLYARIANLFNSLYMATVDLDEKMLFINVISQFVLFGHPPSTMDAVSATIFDYG
jgi:hypothetical protein